LRGQRILPESYAGGGTATGRGSHAGDVKGDDPDKKRYPGPPGWGLGVGLTTPPCKTWICLETSTEASEEEEGWGGHRPKTGRNATEEVIITSKWKQVQKSHKRRYNNNQTSAGGLMVSELSAVFKTSQVRYHPPSVTSRIKM
jgi:hypothetical protein